MAVILEIGDKYPKNCEKCKLFVSQFGSPAYCVAGGKYTKKEIESEKDGGLNMYYHGCLNNRPKNCPLKEGKV